MKVPFILCPLMLVLVGLMTTPLPGQTDLSPSESAYREAAKLETKGDLDGAQAKVTEALQLDPGNIQACVLLGDINAKKQRWPVAEQAFQSALKIDPENALAKFNLAEIKLMQKQFAAARPGFNDLIYDSNLGDLAAYKVFLCDLFGGNKDDAAVQLKAFDLAQGNASYYFANASWLLYDKRGDDARSWLDSAGRIYSPQINHTYLSTLTELGYLPLPAR